MLKIFKKKSLATLLAAFVVLVDELRKLASERLDEATTKHLQAQALKAEAEAAEVEAEEALGAADKIEELIGGSAVLEACAEQL